MQAQTLHHPQSGLTWEPVQTGHLNFSACQKQTDLLYFPADDEEVESESGRNRKRLKSTEIERLRQDMIRPAAEGECAGRVLEECYDSDWLGLFCSISWSLLVPAPGNPLVIIYPFIHPLCIVTYFYFRVTGPDFLHCVYFANASQSWIHNMPLLYRVVMIMPGWDIIWVAMWHCHHMFNVSQDMLVFWN